MNGIGLRKGDPLYKRVLTALLGVPLLIALSFKGGWPFFGIVLFIALVSAGEFAGACLNSGLGVSKRASLAGVTAIMGFSWLTLEDFRPTPLYMMLVLAWIVYMVSRVIRVDMSLLKRVPAVVMVLVYLGLMPVHLLLIRFARGAVPVGGVLLDIGFLQLMWLFLVVWGADIGAYAAGVTLGRRKLCPAISPNKTVEGLGGGILLSVVLGMAAGRAFYPGSPWLLLAATAVVGLTAIIGDLVASLLKRNLSVKDFGAILPGHGGMLDRFDSLIFAAPVAFICLRFLLGG